MQAANRFLTDLRASKLSLGIWQFFPAPSVSRTLARCKGINWILIDKEHGNVADSEMHECIANIAPYGVSPLVRIADKERWMIKRALDAGAHGIMVPLLSTIEEVQEVVQQSKFPPTGKRGLGSPFSVNAFGIDSISEYLHDANSNTAVIIQIETLGAFQNIDVFAKAEGVDVLFIGPYDLSNALGYPLAHGSEHVVVRDAIQKILDTAHRYGKKAGIFTVGEEDVRRRVEQGFDMVHVGSDLHFLQNGVSLGVAVATGDAAKVKGGY